MRMNFAHGCCLINEKIVDSISEEIVLCKRKCKMHNLAFQAFTLVRVN